MFIGLLRACTIKRFGESLVSNLRRLIKSVSLNNHKLNSDNINPDKTLFYPVTVSFNKCGGYCNALVDPYARVCVPNKVKNLNVKVFK